MLLNVVRAAKVFVDDVEGLGSFGMASIYGTEVGVVGWGEYFLGILFTARRWEFCGDGGESFR
jgi:hypothetical protein